MEQMTALIPETKKRGIVAMPVPATPFHIEGSKGTRPKVVKFRLA
jgi:hypothetical protein